jgi:hypothetical protein
MGSRAWTRQDILDFVAGRLTVMYGKDYRPVPVPEWIAEASLGEISAQSATVSSSAYPEDRPGLLRVFLEAISRPGEAGRYRYRTSLRGNWLFTTSHIVDLGDHPDVGGVLCASEPGQETVEEPDMALANAATCSASRARWPS